MRNDIVDMVVEELEAVGLKADVNKGGKHIKIQWQVMGKPRLFICPNTPSDHRSFLNSRSDIRKILRNDAQLIDEHNRSIKTVAQKAFSLPQQVVGQNVSVADRLAKIEEELKTLIDLVLEFIPNKTETTHRKVVSEKKPRAKKPRKYEKVLESLSFQEYTSTGELIRLYGKSVCSMLTYMKHKGLVENYNRGWRKKPLG